MKHYTTPFIKKIKQNNNYYIYDINSNSIFRVDFPVYELIDRNFKNQSNNGRISPPLPESLKDVLPKEIDTALENISAMKAKGYFSSHRPQITYFHSISREQFFKKIRYTLESNLSRISLVLLEECNLRCKYCVYSGCYEYNRVHSNKIMSSETMKKAVDFYFKNSVDNKEKRISFYGGEPLLNFDLIKECVAYVKEKYSTYDISFNMTTNGTLLNEERITFLKENSFGLLISVDGPKTIHDRNRIFKNGKGTFDCVSKNLKRMKKMFPDYYSTRVRFNMVVTPPIDFDSIEEYVNDDSVKPKSIKFSDVTSNFTNFFDRFTEEQLNEFTNTRVEFLDTFNQKLIDGKQLNRVEESWFKGRYLYFHQREMKMLGEKYPSNGQCMVGEKTLMVNTDGSLNFCTQVEDTFNIGDLDSGFNYPVIEQTYNDLDQLFAKHCYNCWAIRLCLKCIKDVSKNGIIDEEVFKKTCRSRKEIIENKINDYLRIRESNPQAMQFLDGVKFL